MSKGYWVTSYRKTNDPAKLAAYAQLAAPAVAGRAAGDLAGLDDRELLRIVRFVFSEIAVRFHTIELFGARRVNFLDAGMGIG